MRNIFAVARLTPVLSFVVVAILVFSIFALLKISSGGKQEPGQELLTGSVQKSPAVRKPPSDDPVASFVAPSSFQPTLRRVQIGVVVRTPVPLPARGQNGYEGVPRFLWINLFLDRALF